MSTSLKLETQILDNKVEVKVSGQIDEDATFEKILNIKQEVYIFDLEGVSLINSCGVREWINFLEKLPEDADITYKNVPQIVVEQINMVQGFVRPGARITSFYAPYYNEEKDEVVKVLLQSDEVANGKAPSKSEDGTDLEFDAIEAQYFNFLKQQG
ncbi:MAG: hypothetical protein EP326_15775 [Deltaproteobacteria bacterium]|nr:MAG: hypothetical protein EP326_15775 [Deltaproteobacteria bacterium]TNF30902.1 MAG: hypothetical protein EP319_03770 [Deltaproteobacteria bacterium]